jgi:hypothetical protein
VLLSREISTPSRKVLKSPFLHRFASTGFLTPRTTISNAILARELVKGRTQPPFRDAKRQPGIRSVDRWGAASARRSVETFRHD